MDPQQQHQQEMSSNSNTLENMLGCSKEKKPKPQAEHAQKCPRCESTNTKFCYYNNYSLSQPRYFCKSCRRYWTKGGTLRNVPVGGGCRKNKRSSSSSSKRSQSQDQQPLMISTNQNPVLSHLASSYDSNDLTLAFARLQKQQQSGGHHLGFDHQHDQFSNILGSAVAANQGGSFLDALRCGYLETQTQNQNPNNFQTLYYGYEGNGEVENGSGSCGGGDASGEMVLPYGHEMGTTTATTTAVTVTTMKQEICNDNYRDQGSDQNRLLWGLPWQLNGDHHQSINVNNNLGDLDSGRESWNGFAPSWHGLLNSPLM